MPSTKTTLQKKLDAATSRPWQVLKAATTEEPPFIVIARDRCISSVCELFNPNAENDALAIAHAVNHLEPLMDLGETFIAYIAHPEAFDREGLARTARAVLAAARMETP